MNRISGKPLKTRGSGTLDVAEIPCLILEPCQGSTDVAVTDGHSGHKSDPSASSMTPQNVIEEAQIRLKKSVFFRIMESWQKQGSGEVSVCHIFMKRGGGCR